MRPHHHWMEREREIVRIGYKNTRESAVELARRLSALTGENITIAAVLWQAGELGIRRSRGRTWLPKENRQLRELAPKYCLTKVARILRRSPSSVRDKCYALGMRLRFRDGWFNITDVASILGVSRTLVLDRIKHGSLVATLHSEGASYGHGNMWHIKQADLVQFIRKYPNEMEGRNIDIVAIVDLLSQEASN